MKKDDYWINLRYRRLFTGFSHEHFPMQNGSQPQFDKKAASIAKIQIKFLVIQGEDRKIWTLLVGTPGRRKI